MIPTPPSLRYRSLRIPNNKKQELMLLPLIGHCAVGSRQPVPPRNAVAARAVIVSSVMAIMNAERNTG